MTEKINTLRDLINESKRLVFLTGAGVSVASGIPDYRSAGGLYSQSPEYMMSIECYENEPAEFHDFMRTRLDFRQNEPNVIHSTIARLQEDREVTVVTQNIDSLHTKAGSNRVIEYHGNLSSITCPGCEHKSTQEQYFNDSKCPECEEEMKPDIVLYGMNIDMKTTALAINAVHNADLIIITGTSMEVAPFNQLIYHKNGASKIVVINRRPIDIASDLRILGYAEDVFSRI